MTHRHCQPGVGGASLLGSVLSNDESSGRRAIRRHPSLLSTAESCSALLSLAETNDLLCIAPLFRKFAFPVIHTSSLSPIHCGRAQGVSPLLKRNLCFFPDRLARRQWGDLP
ncbi:hypothetical protein N8I77_011982 [Diaporthe amygdali]|uniref:Uncharacterized protein n=1 Tax=Phomopsis amygdali TaxID=1214568 RepID=A0AAD9S3U6_PHOAM|nr:hypothetical protein N8I77_011982 [Diaporthe amygdali]